MYQAYGLNAEFPDSLRRTLPDHRVSNQQTLYAACLGG